MVRVMLVEDEEELREILLAVLESEGLDCKAACDGQDALAKLAELKAQGWVPQVIISDISMPKMNGFDLIKTLKETRALVPFIFMSGHADQSVEAQAKELGAVALHTKPFKTEQILEQIRTVVVSAVK